MPHKPDPTFDPDFAGPAQWAAEYRAYGLQVVPCYSPEEVAPGEAWKRPRLSEWTHLQEKLVPEETFARWYDPVTGENRNRRNMGLLTGRCSDNAYIIDLDAHKNPAAMDWWTRILEVHNSGLDLETPRQRTGGGGLQILFHAPPGFEVPTNRTTIGVDIRGQGGFAVLPPSLHETGNFYDWEEGHSLRDMPILMSPPWLLEEVVRVVAEYGGASGGGGGSKTNGGASVGELDAFGHRIDGREEAMRDLVWAALIGLKVIAPMGPPSAADKEAVWADWVRGYWPKIRLENETIEDGLEREGRGRTLFDQKWAYTYKTEWDTGIAEAAKVRIEREKIAKDPVAKFERASQKAKQTGDIYEYLTVEQILALPPPRWMVDKLVIEQSLGFIYGPPGSLKTFLALDIALSVATKQSNWWGYGVNHTGTVIYILGEGVLNLPFRLLAWEQHRGVNIRKAPFVLIRKSINFLKDEDVGKLINTVQDVADNVGAPIAAVFVDTVSRVLPGAKENLQEDMTIFVAACSAVQQQFGATVFGIHHTNYAGGFRGSTVIPGAGDFLIETRREPGDMFGSILAKKVKDGEDGWERPFMVTKVPVGVLGIQTSLVLDGTDEQAASDDSAWPSQSVLLQIIAAIDEQWTSGQPWCWSPNSPRCAVNNIINRWDNIRRAVAEDILQKWHARGIIAEEVKDAKNHIKGYRKLANV